MEFSFEIIISPFKYLEVDYQLTFTFSDTRNFRLKRDDFHKRKDKEKIIKIIEIRRQTAFINILSIYSS